MIGHIELTDSDLENILLWYNRAFNKKNNSTQSDKNTITKLQAILIAKKETGDRFSQPMGRFG